MNRHSPCKAPTDSEFPKTSSHQAIHASKEASRPDSDGQSSRLSHETGIYLRICTINLNIDIYHWLWFGLIVTLFEIFEYL